MRKQMNKKLKSEKINFINKKHSVFMKEQLKGPLRKQRSMSKVINLVLLLFGVKF